MGLRSQFPFVLLLVVALRPFSGDRYPACIRAPHTPACRQVYVVNNTKYNQMGAIVTD